MDMRMDILSSQTGAESQDRFLSSLCWVDLLGTRTCWSDSLLEVLMTWLCSSCDFYTRDAREAFLHRRGDDHHVIPVPDRVETGIEKELGSGNLVVMKVAK